MEQAPIAAGPLEASVGLPGGIRLTVVERCELQDWKDACVDVAIKRTEAVWSDRVNQLGEQNAELRQLLKNMEAARDAALRLKVERQPELGRIADALCEYNERDDQDAGRYRWLRKHAAAKLRRITQDLTWMQSARGTDGKLNVAHPEIQAMLDEEIDNAMMATAPQPTTDGMTAEDDKEFNRAWDVNRVAR